MLKVLRGNRRLRRDRPKKRMDWYGGITNHESRTITINCNFLKAGASYEAIIYTDDASATKVNIEKRKVDATTVLTFPLLASGGVAIETKSKQQIKSQ